jgi:octaprenyl-diphosphate synthase
MPIDSIVRQELVQTDPTVVWQNIRRQVGDQLSQVESLLARTLDSRYDDVARLAQHAASLGGKRLRPCLTLLTALATGQCNEDSLKVAATVELVHAASLVHDDVLDNAKFRRHLPTVHSQIGVHDSIVLGDYLFTRAYGLAAQCRSTFAARAIASSATALCEGELRQQASIGKWSISVDEYYDILRQKTGELCAVSCRLGAWSAGASRATGQALSRFGRKLGIAFQIVDDWLDVWGTTQVGKTLGTDLLQSKPTLPTIRLVESADAEPRESILGILNRLPEGFDAVRQKLDRSDASAYTLECANRLIKSALSDLYQVPQSDARDCLQAVALACTKRAA